MTSSKGSFEPSTYFIMRRYRGRKYRNKPVIIDGIKFPSTKEGNRYSDLKLLQAAGKIQNLVIHPVFYFELNGVKIGRYTADAQYYIKSTPRLQVEDTKSWGTMTTEARRTHKLFKAFYPEHDFVIYGLDNERKAKRKTRRR